MEYYQTREKKISGTDMKEVYKKAINVYKSIIKNSKRRPHIRSKYFRKQKVFLGLFWQHLEDKLNNKDKLRRLKYFSCAIELIMHSNFTPISKENVDKRSEILHRFGG
jgi:hypothetical protein